VIFADRSHLLDEAAAHQIFLPQVSSFIFVTSFFRTSHRKQFNQQGGSETSGALYNSG
jgi:hypothetical protein